MLGWAIIGCGWVARDYVVPAIHASRNGRLVVACDRDAQSLASLGGEGYARTCRVDEAIANAAVDAVYVATPNDSHAAVVSAVAAAGKHVMCEKPIAQCSAAARAMVADCEAAGVRLATAFDQRFHAAHIALADLVRQGRLGIVTQVRLHYACWLPRDWSADNWRVDAARAGGGAVIDLAPHGLDLLETVLGERIEQLVCLTQRRVHDYAVEDGGVLLARLSSGTLASLHVAYNCPETYPRRTLELIGTKARVVALDTMGQTAGGTLTLTDAASGLEQRLPVVDDRCPFMLQVEAFADAVLQQRPFAYPPERDLRLAVMLEEAMSWR